MAVGLRLGTSLCDQHRCPCGTVVDCRGTHGFSCKKSSARIARHSYINDIIYRALVRAKIVSVKEPVGLSRTDGKRPDDLTLIPWQAGKNLVWDITVVSTIANSYLTSTSVTAGSADDLAASRKEGIYVDMATAHIFLPLAFETIGSICSKTLAFLNELGRRLTLATDGKRETVFLFQRLSVATQRYNAVCFADTFSSFQCDFD